MIKKVTYEIHGQIERSCYFRVGKALLRVDFTGGSINSAGMTPAHFTTTNPLYQKAIEESQPFIDGEITVGASENIETVNPVKDSGNNAGEAQEVKEPKGTYTDVANVQQARAVLMAEPYNIPLSELQNKAAIRAKAEECDVLFPNWL